MRDSRRWVVFRVTGGTKWLAEVSNVQIVFQKELTWRSCPDWVQEDTGNWDTWGANSRHWRGYWKNTKHFKSLFEYLAHKLIQGCRLNSPYGDQCSSVALWRNLCWNTGRAHQISSSSIKWAVTQELQAEELIIDTHTNTATGFLILIMAEITSTLKRQVKCLHYILLFNSKASKNQWTGAAMLSWNQNLCIWEVGLKVSPIAPCCLVKQKLIITIKNV